jgi:hypothetical protein
MIKREKANRIEFLKAIKSVLPFGIPMVCYSVFAEEAFGPMMTGAGG